MLVTGCKSEQELRAAAADLQLKVEAKTARLCGSTSPPRWPELRGVSVSVSELHWRGFLDVPVTTGVQGGETGADDLLARVVVGRGTVLFCQAHPEMFPVDAERTELQRPDFAPRSGQSASKTYFRLSRWRTQRLLSQLVNNLGAQRAISARAGLVQASDRAMIVSVSLGRSSKPQQRVYYRVVAQPLSYETAYKLHRGEAVAGPIDSLTVPDPAAARVRVAVINDTHEQGLFEVRDFGDLVAGNILGHPVAVRHGGVDAADRQALGTRQDFARGAHVIRMRVGDEPLLRVVAMLTWCRVLTRCRASLQWGLVSG